MQSSAPQTRIGRLVLCSMLLALASTARANIVFNDDITGECLPFHPGAAGPGSTPIFGSVANDGNGATLWGTCSLTAIGSGSNGLQLSWNGSTPFGAPLYTGETLPYSYDFSVTGPPGAALHWALTLEILGLKHASPEYLLGSGVTAPGGGSISSSSESLQLVSMSPLEWMVDFAVWFDTQPGDTLTVMVPQQSSIDLNVPGPDSAVPEPSGVLLTLTGLGGTLSLARRRSLLK